MKKIILNIFLIMITFSYFNVDANFSSDKEYTSCNKKEKSCNKPVNRTNRKMTTCNKNNSCAKKDVRQNRMAKMECCN